jgi:zinc transport system permease protein
MADFFFAVTHHAFMLNALLAGLLSSVACGVVGTYVVTRRIAYIAGAIAHSVLGGMGAAKYLIVVHGWTWLEPLYGAVVAAILAAMIIGLVSLNARHREDTVIGAIWAAGMAIGILFISQTPGYGEDVMSYLFGNILMVGSRQLAMIAWLDLIVVLMVLGFYHRLLAVCFDEEFARIRGVNVKLFYLLLLILTGLTVVILTSVVGLIMVIALLTIPAAIAGYFTQRVWQTMLAAIALCIGFVVVGLAVSYTPELPTGATIILVAAITYVAVTVWQWRRMA